MGKNYTPVFISRLQITRKTVNGSTMCILWFFLYRMHYIKTQLLSPGTCTVWVRCNCFWFDSQLNSVNWAVDYRLRDNILIHFNFRDLFLFLIRNSKIVEPIIGYTVLLRCVTKMLYLFSNTTYCFTYNHKAVS